MIALKKIYGDELLRLALVLSLLKADPENYLRQEQQLSAGLNLSNGTDWSLEQESRTLLTPRFVHPKSLDNILLNYEREVFEELNSLGRYHNSYSTFIEDAAYQNNERIPNLNSVGGQQTRLAGNVVHTYLVNNVATETVPALLDSVGSAVAGLADASERADLFETSQPYDHVSHDDNVAQEVRVSLSEDDTEEDDDESPERLQIPDDVEVFEEESLSDLQTVIPDPESRVRALPDPEASSQTFDVSDFFVKTEAEDLGANGQDRSAVEVKKEKEEDLYDDGDDAIDHFLPYFADKNPNYDPFADADSVFDQNMADLQDYDETLETLKEFKSNFEYLDVKQQQENLEQYLLENTPLEMEAYDLKPIFEDERFLLDVKLERAGTSFSSDASSSGVSAECDWSGVEIGADDTLGAVETVPSVRVKVEADDDGGSKGADLTQEDMDLIEVLWKQDVDMGFTLDGPVAVPVASPSEPDLKKLHEPDSEKAAGTTKLPLDAKGTELEDIANLKAKLLEDTEGGKKEDPWSGLSYTIDTETGEFVLQGELPGELVGESDAGSFDLLDEALRFVALDDRAERAEGERAAEEPAPAHGEQQDESIMRQMSAEQRWQDLASLLAMPPPPQAAAEPYAPPAAQPPATYHQLQHQLHHAHHAQQHAQTQPSSGLTPHSHLSGGGAYAAGYSPLAPPEKHVADAVYGHPPVPLDLPQAGYKQEAPPQHYQPGQDPLYYQNSSSDMNTTSDGLLSSILNDEDLQLMDMAMNEGMYTMRPLEGAGGAPQPPIGAPHAGGHPAHLMLSSERVDSSSDSAVSSMGSERVPSLSDGEWCDGGSDSAQEYHSSKFRPYDSYAAARPATGEERGAAPPPALVAQKKHHMFGKRAFQEQSSQPVESREPRMAEAVKYEYPETQHAGYHTQDAAIANELKYSCTLEFSTRQAPGYAPPRPAPHGERVRHNHTYSMPVGQLGAAERPQSRDKRARRLTDGSLSDCGSSPGGGNHMTRDEKRAKALGIPLNVQDIINLPMDEFNERLSKHDLSEAQLSLIRDIRRRGKNKVAAQNCRKRKLDQITSLADEVRTVRDRTSRLRRDQQSLLAERQRVKDRFATLYRHVFQNLRDADGAPLSSQQFSLQQAADGSVVLVPRTGSHSGLGLQAGASGADFERERHMNRTSDEELERKNKNYEQ